MPTQVEEPVSEVGVSTLVGGIVQDARHLLVEQLNLFQVEIKNEVERTLRGMIPLTAGAMIVVPGLVILAMSAAYGLSTWVPEIPLWASLALVGTVAAVGGLALIYWGAHMIGSLTATPDNALKSLKENIQWKTKK